MVKRSEEVEAYLAALTDERREALEAVIDVVSKSIDPRFEFGMQYKMPAWYLPHSEYPSGYHCDPKQPLPFASIASQKKHIGLYLFCIYCDESVKERFVSEWKESGKHLDMGKSCVRVKDLESIPMEVLGRAFKRVTAKKFVAAYETSFKKKGL
jgi:hypothetical protein